MKVDLKGIGKSFGDLCVIENIDLEIDSPEIICIVGPSGCGKSTLLNIIGGIINQDQGKIHNQFTKIGYVFQEDRLLPWRSVAENIKLVNDAYEDEEILRLLETLGIEEFKDALPGVLSGGMRQRAAIARAFAYEPDILLMDEPLKSLDFQLRLNILKLLHKVWGDHKCAIVYVTHEIDEALLLGDRVLVMSNRPSCVRKELCITMPKEERQIGSKELEKFRDIIIGELFDN